MRRTTIASVTAAMLIGLDPAAAQACDGLRLVPGGVVTQVTDGDTVVLDSGLVVRMIGTQAPKLPLGREDYPTWPLAPEAQAALAALALNKSVTLGYGGEEVDRYERALAHVFVDTGESQQVWAQMHMIESGLARVYSFPDNRSCLDQLFAGEARARSERLGIWADPYYSVRAADRPSTLLERAGSYELVEGRVLLADRSGSRVFLNFGRFWKEDFTAVIEAPALKLFTQDGLDLLTLEGALIRVRGWVDDRDGPRIEVTHPEQIEVLAGR
ncbi:thermonuclease family protein [Devosia sp. XJ19-1]|uniref:Thermonuclease family protein n=1 Tax=Devosia ureilytica TaxID=2952754 RepID=A0A9Q4AST9_9HYPH|nr:thermonuclease family protein [Devosia ureilytica]MCP8885391.1 thermonuclease family protein [Devosia ureilytica]MCP8888933.1 thermonuclease family protein [Devosia ureilytica]